MIELIATGPVNVTESVKIDRDDGHDSIYGRVERTDTIEVQVDLEFEQGHVNLEGYAPSRVDWSMEEILGRYVEQVLDADVGAFRSDMRLPRDEWEIKLHGEWFDWIQQAHRYQTERPGKSLVDCLELFQRWDETSDKQLMNAVGVLGETDLEMANRPMGEMSDEEYEEMRETLNSISNVRIPESYSG